MCGGIGWSAHFLSSEATMPAYPLANIPVICPMMGVFIRARPQVVVINRGTYCGTHHNNTQRTRQSHTH